MNKIVILALATTAALAFSPASARDHRVYKLEFLTVDANGDGQITKAELQAYSAAEFSKVDTDGNGSLSIEELTAKANERRLKRIKKRAKWMFQQLDVDGNGTVALAEMRAKRGGEWMFEHLDENEDGMISHEEFDVRKGKRGDKRKRNNDNS